VAPSSELTERYRKAVRSYLLLLLLFTPVVFVLAFGTFKLFGTFIPGFVLAGIWASLWFVGAIRAILLRFRIHHSN